MAQLKRYNGTSWEVVGGSIAPKTSITTSDTDTYSCNYVNDQMAEINADISNIQSDLEDTGWVDLEYKNQNVYQRPGDLYKVQIRRWGRFVQIKGQIISNVGDLSDNQSLAIPSSVLSDFYTGNMEIQMITNACFYWIDASGVLHITSNPGQYYINLGGTYMYA